MGEPERRRWPASRCAVVLTAAVVGAGLIAGCVSSSMQSKASVTTVASAATPSQSSTASAPPSTPPAKARYIARADAICTAATKRLAAGQTALARSAGAERGQNTAANRRAYAVALDRGVDVIAPQLRELQRLTPPAADRGYAVSYVQSTLAQSRLIRQLASAIGTNDTKRIKAISLKINEGTAYKRAVARAHGFQVCGVAG